LGAEVHEFDEFFFVAADFMREGEGAVVVGGDEEGVHHVGDGDFFAGAEGDVAGFDVGVFGGDDDGAVEAHALVNEEGGHEFDGAGGEITIVGVALVEDFGGGGIDEEYAAGLDFFLEVFVFRRAEAALFFYLAGVEG
jgi:hypothetical protein